MNRKFRKIAALALVVSMSVLFAGITAYAKIEPRVAVQISMSTNVDLPQKVKPQQEITATVTWKGIRALAGERITIQATEDAQILIYDESDVTFEADSNNAAVTNIVRSVSGDRVTFMSGTPATSPLENTVTFKVKAPLDPGSFKISAKIGEDTVPDNPVTNFVEKDFTVKSLITVNTSEGYALYNNPFEIFGEINYDDAFMVALEVRHQETGEVVYSTTTMDFADDGSYDLGEFMFHDSDEDGIYILEAILLDSQFSEVASAIKGIDLQKIVKITVSYVDIDTGQILRRYAELGVDGREHKVINLDFIYLDHHEVVGALVNGVQTIDYYPQNVPVMLDGPAEVVFLCERLYQVAVRYIYDTNPNHVWVVYYTRYKADEEVTISAPNDSGEVVGVLVDGVPAALINGNQVELTITKDHDVRFIYKDPASI